MESWKAAGSFSWGVERQEKVGERIAAGVGIKPGDARDARDAALEAASGDEDDDVDRLGDQPARDGDDRLLHEALDAVEGRHGTVGMDGGDAAGEIGRASCRERVCQ